MKSLNLKFLIRLHSTGMTLIEIIVAITILAFMMINVVIMTGDSAETKDRVIAEDKEFVQLQMALNRINWDLSHLYSPIVFSSEKNLDPPKTKEELEDMGYINPYKENQNFRGEAWFGGPIPVFKSPDKSTIQVFTFNNRRKIKNSKESIFSWIVYTLRESIPDEKNKERKDTFEIIRYSLNKNPFLSDEMNLNELKAHKVLDNVIELEFQFFDDKKDKFVTYNGLTDTGDIVRAIKMRIVWYDPAGEETEVVKIFRTPWPRFKPENMQSLWEAAQKPKNSNNSKNNNNNKNENNENSGNESE